MLNVLGVEMMENNVCLSTNFVHLLRCLGDISGAKGSQWTSLFCFVLCREVAAFLIPHY